MVFTEFSYEPGVMPSNNDPHNQIRFADIGEAEQRRQTLIEFIWPDGLPHTQPLVTEGISELDVADHLEGLDHNLVARIDRLETDVLGVRSLAYRIHPKQKAEVSRLAIIHAGHSKLGAFIKRDYTDSIHLFLRFGFQVVMMHMPQRGWNDYGTAELPNGVRVDISSPEVYKAHAAIINLPSQDEGLSTGAGFRVFLEPVIAVINAFKANGGEASEVVMLGLSGGGWTTHMAAALDKRIQLSFAVAGSYPLYLRNQLPCCVGDLEQYFFPLYDEDIAADGSGGGIATWLEIYALGGIGAKRHQLMLTAPHDSCCFNGDPEQTVDTFKDVVADSVKNIGQGQWQHQLDTTHKDHMISPWIIEKVVEPVVSDFISV